MADNMLYLTRTVAADHPNPNTRVVYSNTEDKLKEAIETFKVGMHNGIPVDISNCTGNISDRMEVKLSEYIGDVVHIGRYNVDIQLNELGVRLRNSGAFVGCSVQFCYIADLKNNMIEHVIKANIVSPLKK